MRVKFVVVSGLAIGVLLAALLNVLTPRNKLKPSEVEVCAAFGLGLGLGLERLTRRPEHSSSGVKKKKGKKR